MSVNVIQVIQTFVSQHPWHFLGLLLIELIYIIGLSLALREKDKHIKGIMRAWEIDSKKQKESSLGETIDGSTRRTH